jgi:hypothetical protein
MGVQFLQVCSEKTCYLILTYTLNILDSNVINSYKLCEIRVERNAIFLVRIRVLLSCKCDVLNNLKQIIKIHSSASNDIKSFNTSIKM